MLLDFTHFLEATLTTSRLSIYHGDGNCLSPLRTALPTTLGHVMIFSKKSAASLMKGNSPSKAIRTHHHQAQNHAIGHAIKISRRNQMKEYKIFSAIL
mmetsp:Transcript_11778/g.24771  ORF Transcript_11778/g.24771 Transcript_11778/m.24771 type:complete len:98 (-) Transcript_11778:143-436(-)